MPAYIFCALLFSSCGSSFFEEGIKATPIPESYSGVSGKYEKKNNVLSIDYEDGHLILKYIEKKNKKRFRPEASFFYLNNSVYLSLRINIREMENSSPSNKFEQMIDFRHLIFKVETFNDYLLLIPPDPDFFYRAVKEGNLRGSFQLLGCGYVSMFQEKSTSPQKYDQCYLFKIPEKELRQFILKNSDNPKFFVEKKSLKLKKLKLRTSVLD